MFRAALERTVPQGLDRGAGETKSTVVVNPADAADLSCDGEDITLCQLRTLLLSQHVSKLLQANGFVLFIYGTQNPKCKKCSSY